MRNPSRGLAQALESRPRALLCLLGLALATAAGVSVWAVSADAHHPVAPTARAVRAALAVRMRGGVELAAPASLLRGGEIVFGRGPARGQRARIGATGDEIIASLTGSLVPVAVDSTDGSVVVYSAWRQLAAVQPDTPGQGLRPGQPVGIPSIRAYDAETRTDRLVATGAASPAVSPDGRLAFLHGDAETLRADEDYTGKVVVGFAGDHRFEPWTSRSARYFPYAWAGGTLLVYQALPGSEATDLYAYTGPDTRRLIAPEAFVVAVSPDGSRVLVTVDRRMVEIVRVADGSVEASMPLEGTGVASADSPGTPHYLMYSGSWYGDRVVANSDVGLLVLNVADGIRIETVFAAPRFEHGLVEPTLTDHSHVIGWADLAGTAHPIGKKEEPAWDHALVSCDLAAASCTVGDPHPARSWTRWVRNPSR